MTDNRLSKARQLVAQGWCTDRNSHKVMDIDLANAIAKIIAPHLAPEKA